MKTRKRIQTWLAAALCLALLGSLAACGGKAEDTADLSAITGKTYTMSIADCQATALVGESYKDAVSYGYKNLENGYFTETNTLVLGSNGRYKLTKHVDTGMNTISMAHFTYVFSGTYTASGNTVKLSAATYAEVEDDFGGYVVAMTGVPHTGDPDSHKDDSGTVTGGTGTSKAYPEILEYFNSEVLTKGGNSEQTVTISDELGQFAYGENAVISAPTEPATEAPTEPPTEAPTDAPTEPETVGGYTFTGTCAASEYFAVVCTLNADGTVDIVRGIPNEGEWMMASQWTGTWTQADGAITITVDQTEEEQTLGAAPQSTYTAVDDGSGTFAFRWYKNGLTAEGEPAGSAEEQAYYSDLTTAET